MSKTTQKQRDGLDVLQEESPEKYGCLSRRHFLLTGTSAVACLALMPTGIAGAAKGLPAVQTTHPRMKIGTVSALREGVAVNFMYPSPKFGPSFLVKLGTEAGGGVGKGSDIVAFNGMCPHMGGPLIGMYKHEYKAVGPCPLHLTTFDLTRFGMIITGQATESLPQVTLELDGDDIYAVGFLGLVYGRNSNA